jgi:NAD(P)-dependent dehydrogenase (short-subunit alcohol dehydrogenase family)
MWISKGMNMGKLEGKTALITGGNSGIGLATAKLFVHEGADVFITGRRQEALNAAVAAIGSRAIGVQGDVSNLNDLDRLVAAIKAKGVSLDVVFANAGAGTLAPIADVTEEHYHQIFDTNVKGVVFTIQKVLPLIKERWGHHPELLDCWEHGHGFVQHVFGSKGRYSQFRSRLGQRLEASPNTSERHQSRRCHYSWLQRSWDERRPNQRIRRAIGHKNAVRENW